jgi:hypothetical protein
VHWFPEHGETEAGPVLEIRLSAAEMWGWGMREMLAGHGPHCDRLLVDWAGNQAQVRCTMSVRHYGATVAGFLEAREKARLEAERAPPIDNPPNEEVPIVPWLDPPEPQPPEPEPGDGS